MSTTDQVTISSSPTSLRPKRSSRRMKPATVMDPIVEALRLLQRQAAIRSDLRRSPGSGVTAERELFLIRNRLAQYRAEVQVITLTAAELQRPIDTLSIRDVEKRC